MDIAVIGGRGFVGSAVVDALDGHDVTTVDPTIGGTDHLSADITVASSITSALDGFDAVINLAGLSPVKKPRGTSYEAVHAEGARNVVAACRANGVGTLVHMSALGADPDASTAFLRTKGEGEAAVLDSGLDVTVIRPSIIVDAGNELVRMAARFAPTRLFPRITVELQPVMRGDVADLFRLAVTGGIDRETVDVGGPERMTLYDLAAAIYEAKGYTCHPVPVQTVMRLGLYTMGVVPFVPYGPDQARFLAMDNVPAHNDAADLVDLSSVTDWIAETF